MSENTQVDRSQQEYFEKMKYFEDLVGSQASYFAFSLATKRRVLGYDWIIFVAGRDRVFSTPGKLCAQGMRRRMCAIALYCCDLCTYGGSRGKRRLCRGNGVPRDLWGSIFHLSFAFEARVSLQFLLQRLQ